MADYIWVVRESPPLNVTMMKAQQLVGASSSLSLRIYWDLAVLLIRIGKKGENLVTRIYSFFQTVPTTAKVPKEPILRSEGSQGISTSRPVGRPLVLALPANACKRLSAQMAELEQSNTATGDGSGM
ncbi:hypothetical protein MMC13_004701 [Lambiella insularis]|nr:hypothetical protein [Lambiella insularis]